MKPQVKAILDRLGVTLSDLKKQVTNAVDLKTASDAQIEQVVISIMVQYNITDSEIDEILDAYPAIQTNYPEVVDILRKHSSLRVWYGGTEGRIEGPNVTSRILTGNIGTPSNVPSNIPNGKTNLK